jgi:hypothetical protein
LEKLPLADAAVPFNQAEIEKGVLDVISTKGCQDFAKTILDAVAKKRKGLGTLEEVAKKFFAQSGQRFTRNRPPRSRGYANPIGRIAENRGQIYVKGSITGGANAQLSTDIGGTIAELFHLAAEGRHYSDEEVATAVYNSSYAADANSKIATTEMPLIDPRENPFESSYLPNPKDPDKSLAYSRYFHTIQAKYCTNEPNTIRGVPFQGR